MLPFFLLGLLLGPSQEPPADLPVPPLPKRIVASEISLSSLREADGPRPWSRLTGKRGTVVVWLDIGCPMAKAYLARLERLHKRFQPAGLALVGVISPMVLPPAGKDTQAKEILLRKFTDRGVTFPLVIDSALELQKTLDARVTPEAFLLDSTGKCLYRGRIDDEYSARLESRGQIDRNDLLVAIEEVLAGKPVSLPATRAFGCPLLLEMRGPSAPTPGSPDFYAHVLPILRAKCQECHSRGSFAPFELENLDQARRWAKDIRDYTKARRMPPWLPTSGVQLRDARHLTNEEIETLSKWVADDCPEGTPLPASKPVIQDNPWTLGQPHLVLEPGAPVEIAPEGKDLIRCLVLPTGLKEGRYVSAVEILPGNRSLVHHVELFIDTQGNARKLEAAPKSLPETSDKGPGYNSAMGPGFFPVAGTLPGWAPGFTPVKLEPGLGYWLPAGSDLIVRIHYHRSGLLAKDLTRVGLQFVGSGGPPIRPLQEIAVGSAMFHLHPNDPNTTVSASLYVRDDAILHHLRPHMHRLGKSMRIAMVRPGQPQETLLEIARWDPEWEETYSLKKPIAIPAGTQLLVQAVYDNSRLNPRNPNKPPKAVLPGDTLADEMCYAYFGISGVTTNSIATSQTPTSLPLRKPLNSQP